MKALKKQNKIIFNMDKKNITHKDINNNNNFRKASYNSSSSNNSIVLILDSSKYSVSYISD